jgi:hypothetical protein
VDQVEVEQEMKFLGQWRTGNTPPTSPPQGNPGGTSLEFEFKVEVVVGGGGGAGAAGSNGPGNRLQQVMLVWSSWNNKFNYRFTNILLVEEVVEVVDSTWCNFWSWWWWNRWRCMEGDSCTHLVLLEQQILVVVEVVQWTP